MANEEKENSIRTAFFLNVAFTVLEFIGGMISGSIAILADSLHDFADSISLGAGWYLKINQKKAAQINTPTAMPAFHYWVP